MAVSKNCHNLSVNFENLWTAKHKELVPNVMKGFNEEKALEILKISQNSVIIEDKQILSLENETLKKTSFKELA